MRALSLGPRGGGHRAGDTAGDVAVLGPGFRGSSVTHFVPPAPPPPPPAVPPGAPDALRGAAGGSGWVPGALRLR